MSIEGLPFEEHAVDHPGSVVCRMCGRDVPLPTTEPWLVLEGIAAPPDCLVSLRCPHCRRRIYLNAADEHQRAQDEAADALDDDASSPG